MSVCATSDGTWWIDENRNRWHRFLFPEEAAWRLSHNLHDCRDCVDCSNCSNCVDCVDCLYCYDCVSCEYCEGCLDCGYCDKVDNEAGAYKRKGTFS